MGTWRRWSNAVDCNSTIHQFESDCPLHILSGCGSVWSERAPWEREVASSNLVIPTIKTKQRKLLLLIDKWLSHLSCKIDNYRFKSDLEI